MTENQKETLVLPLRGYQLVENRFDPSLVAIAFDTEQGPHMFVATREMLEDLSKAFTARAATMPYHKK